MKLMVLCSGQLFASAGGDMPPFQDNDGLRPFRHAKRSVRTHEDLKNIIVKYQRTPHPQGVEEAAAAQSASEALAITHLRSAFQGHAHAAPLHFKVALELSKHPRVHANVYLGLGKLDYVGEVMDELVDAGLCYKRAFEIAQKEGLVAEKIFASIGRGSVALHQTPPQNEVAKGHFLDALHFCGEVNTVMRARVFVWLGMAGVPFYLAGPRDENNLPMLRPYTAELCYKEALDALRVPLGLLKESAREVRLVACKKLFALCMLQCRHPEARLWRHEIERMTTPPVEVAPSAPQEVQIVSTRALAPNETLQTLGSPPFTFVASSTPVVMPPLPEDSEDPCEALQPLVVEEEGIALLEGNL